MQRLDEDLQNWLTQYVAACAAVAGTVHRHENGGLRLAAAINIPDPVREAVAWVPSGKGMAGLALERGEVVQTCNLQADASGAARPGAKAVNAQAAAAFPVRDQAGRIIAIVGVAFADEREITEAELERLTAAAESLPGARA
jgi:L-methionine (R)-S-oxide reductase